MTSLETYQKIHEYKKLGLSKRKISMNLGVSVATVTKWWEATEEEFLNAEKPRFEYLDNYKEFMLMQIRTCPQIRVTNLFFKIKENFPDFECQRTTFYRYVQKLRFDYGYEHFLGRQLKPRKPLPPSYEAQVDFGQCKMKDMYGRTTRVYFFCNYDTKSIPREAFMEEAATLVKMPYRGDYANNIRNVSAKYDVTYQGSRYWLPKDKVRVKEAVRIEEDEDTLFFIRAGDGVIIHTEKKAESPGTQVPLKAQTKNEAVSLSTLQRLYQNNDSAMEFIAQVEKTVVRYKNTHYRWVIKLSKVYTDDQIENAMEHCLKLSKCTAQELAAYLIYKYGEGAAREKMKYSLFTQCRVRATELKEELK